MNWRWGRTLSKKSSKSTESPLWARSRLDILTRRENSWLEQTLLIHSDKLNVNRQRKCNIFYLDDLLESCIISCWNWWSEHICHFGAQHGYNCKQIVNSCPILTINNKILPYRSPTIEPNTFWTCHAAHRQKQESIERSWCVVTLVCDKWMSRFAYIMNGMQKNKRAHTMKFNEATCCVLHTSADSNI